MSKITGSSAIVDILEREGVRYVFGVPGGPILGLCDAIEKSRNIEFVLTRHEQGAAFAAFAYAHSTGQLGVCAATLGPGATNLLAGLPVAAIEGAPLLALTGQVQTSAISRGGHQESSDWYATPDQHAMYAAVCKKSTACYDAAQLPQILRNSIRLAFADRPGPVHLELHSGVLHDRTNFTPMPPSAYRVVDDRRVDIVAAKRVANRIAAARAPVLLIGSRAFRPDCSAECDRLAKLAGMGIVCDIGAKSAIDERSDHFLGCIGVLAHRAAEAAIKDHADLIVAVGMTFDEISTLSWDPAFVEGRELVQLDSVAEEIGKAFPVADAALGHLPSLLNAVSAAIRTLPEPLLRSRLDGIAQIKRRYPLFADREMQSEKVPVLPQRVVFDLRAALPDTALILSDSSKWARWLARFFEAAKGQILSAHDYEPMGWAVAGAIGAKLAYPDRTVISVSGDGAFLMSAVELATSRQLGLPIVWIVMEDRRLGIIHDLQVTMFHGRAQSAELGQTTQLDRFGEVFGIESAIVTKPGELSQVLADALARDVAKLIIVRFDIDEIPSVRPRSLVVTRNMGLPPPSPGPETTRALIKLLKDR